MNNMVESIKICMKQVVKYLINRKTKDIFNKINLNSVNKLLILTCKNITIQKSKMMFRVDHLKFLMKIFISNKTASILEMNLKILVKEMNSKTFLKIMRHLMDRNK